MDSCWRCNLVTMAIKVLNMGIVASPIGGGALTREELDELIDAGADISGANVSEIEDFSELLKSKYSNTFNQDISGWDVSAATDMSEMFRGQASFNQNIGSWDVSNVTDMALMFRSAADFNQDIGDWDVSKVASMKEMFKGANDFNQDISDWDFDDVTSATTGFNGFMNGKTGGSVMSTANYNALLVQIEATNEETNLVFDGGGAIPTGAGDTARAALITRGWTITDGDS